VCALSTPKEKSTAVLSAIKRGEGGKPIANANRPFQSEFTRVQAWGKRNEEPQIQIPTVIKWIIPDATCVVVLTATSSVRLAKRNSRLLASSYKNAAAAAAFVVVFARGQNATELLVRMRRRRRDPLFAYIAPPAVFNLARLRLYSQGSKAASAGSFRCHLSATATRRSHAAILIATATATALPLLPGIVCGVLHRHNESIAEAWSLNSSATYQHPFITSGSSLSASSSCFLTLMALWPNPSRATLVHEEHNTQTR